MTASGNYLIIGGTSGIGLHLAQSLSAAGNQVTVIGRRQVSLSGITAIQADALSNDLDLSLLPGQLHGFVYCPGSINLKPFHRLSDHDFLDDFNLNVLGAVRSIRQVLPLLKSASRSSIVLFSTVAASKGMPFHTSIAASKGAIEGLTRSLAAELSPSIRVNAIAPSLTDTPLAARLLSSEEKRQASADRHPLKRIGTAQDITNIASFLLSPDASWITGQIIHVDGGLSSIA